MPLSPPTTSADFKTIVDVAGGHGGLIAAILAANPHTRGMLLELPPVIAGASASLQNRGIADCCQVIGGDMFASVPSGGDAHILKRTLHNWDDERARTILANCASAMKEGGRVLVVDMVIPLGNEAHPGKFYDLLMMVMLGGRERHRTRVHGTARLGGGVAATVGLAGP